MNINTTELMELFLDFSVYLTGFSRFHLNGTGQASLYFDTIQNIIGKELFQELLVSFGDKFNLAIKQSKDESILAEWIRSEILGSEKFGPIARNIIKLWYVATWYQLPKDWRDSYGTQINDKTFIPSPEAYAEGLLWPTIGVNPPAAKAPGYATWSEPPAVSLPNS